MDNQDFFIADYPWIPDNGDGTYKNPVLFADYSDPDVIRVGEDFYLIASSFAQAPGLPVLHSRDLVNWRIVANALDSLPRDRYREVHPGCGVWAPAIRHHDGLFWIFFPMPDEGIFVTTAENPAGLWCEPWLLQEGKGLIDPCPFWDDDGTGWLIFAYAKSRCGIKHKLHLRPMSSDGKELLGPGEIVFDGAEDHPTLEGPKMHKFDGYYYISAPAGGVPYGWQVILRSKNIYGPYDESRVVLEQKGSVVNGPHQGALVDDREGNWWFLHFQEHQPYGRIGHLQPVSWHEGWPMMGHLVDGVSLSGKPVMRHPKPAGESDRCIPQTSDDFESKTLGLQWAFQGGAGRDYFSLSDTPGRLRLRAYHSGAANLSKAPNAIHQKTPSRMFRVETSLDFSHLGENDEAGLAVLGLSSAALVVTRASGAAVMGLRIDDELVMTRPLKESKIILTLSFGRGGVCQFGWKEGDDIEWFGPSVQAKEGTWIGARVGLFCSTFGPIASEGFAEFEYFRFAPVLERNQREVSCE